MVIYLIIILYPTYYQGIPCTFADSVNTPLALRELKFSKADRVTFSTANRVKLNIAKLIIKRVKVIAVTNANASVML